jgi:NifU-like protein involved in Fe-S cluster formation
MAATNEGKLYSAALLSLATELAAYPYSDTSAFKASERSRTCGSTIDVSIEIDSKNHVTTIGLRVAACAVGQASAALLARSVEGKSCAAVNDAHLNIANWLVGKGELPDWPGITALAPARDYAGRHEALLLPWKAASSALCKRATAS